MAFAPRRAEAYLRDMADTDRALSRQLTELLELIRQYGPEAVADAIEKAAAARAFGADYVANILRQQQSPRRPQPPLRLRDPRLNELVTDPLSLLEYDAFILEAGKESDDAPRTETEPTEPVHDEPPTGDDDLLKPPPRTSAWPPPWNGLPIWNWKPASTAPSNAASNARACRRSPASTPFTFTITRAASQAKNRILRLLDLDVPATRAPISC